MEKQIKKRIVRNKSKIRCFIVEHNDAKHYWYSFDNENKKPSDVIVQKMYKRIKKHFGITKVVIFYENQLAGYSGNIVKKYINGICVI